MKIKLHLLLIACSLFVSSCRKDDGSDPKIVALPYDAKVVGRNCGMPLIQITRNNDSLVASGIIEHAYAKNNYYAIVNLPDSLGKIGTELNLDVRATNDKDGFIACNLSRFNYLQIAIITARKK